MKPYRVVDFLLPFVGLVFAGCVWAAASTAVPDLPSPLKTWHESKLYLLEPFTKRDTAERELKSFRTQVERELNKLERRGATSRRKARTRARQTRNRVQRQVKQRRRRFETTVKQNRTQVEKGLKQAQTAVSERVTTLV